MIGIRNNALVIPQVEFAVAVVLIVNAETGSVCAALHIPVPAIVFHRKHFTVVSDCEDAGVGLRVSKKQASGTGIAFYIAIVAAAANIELIVRSCGLKIVHHCLAARSACRGLCFSDTDTASVVDQIVLHVIAVRMSDIQALLAQQSQLVHGRNLFPSQRNRFRSLYDGIGGETAGAEMHRIAVRFRVNQFRLPGFLVKMDD